MGEFSKTKLFVFDLDETLSESKKQIDLEMATLLGALLSKQNVAVISGGFWKQLERQLVAPLEPHRNLFPNLFVFPTCGASFYRFKDGAWTSVYELAFTPEEKESIFNGFSRALTETGFVPPARLYGELIEDRHTQITFSAFGQGAPFEVKGGWDPDLSKRKPIIEVLERIIPDFEIRAGGATSIDVTRKGVDKAYGIRQMETHLSVPKEEMIFIGDRIYPGGNDYPVKTCGVRCIQVTGPEETKKHIKDFLSTDYS